MKILPSTEQDNETFCSLVQYLPTRNFRGIKLVRDGSIVAMAGYDHWTPNSVEMHSLILDKKGMTKSFLREIFWFPFEFAQKGLVVGVTPSDNAAALELNRKLGFRQVYTLKDGWSTGVDMIIQEMRREDCKWLLKEAA